MPTACFGANFVSALTFSALVLLISLLVFPLSQAQVEIFCVRCNATYIILSIERSKVDPTEVNITATLNFFEIPTGRDPMQIIEYARENKIDPEVLRRITAAGPAAGENITFIFNITSQRVIDGTVQTFVEERVLGVVTTDSNGIARLSTKIEGVLGCGSIIARFEGTATLLPTEASTLFCVGGVVPFATLLEIEPWKCLTLFVFLGLLVAGLYAMGRKPLAAFDITTPKPPKIYEYPGYKYKKIGIIPTIVAAAALPRAAVAGAREVRRLLHAPSALRIVREITARARVKPEEVERAYEQRFVPWRAVPLARTMLVKYVLEPKVVESLGRKVERLRADLSAEARAAGLRPAPPGIKFGDWYAAWRASLPRDARARLDALIADLERHERRLAQLKFFRDLYVRRESSVLDLSAPEYAAAREKEARNATAAIDAIYDEKYIKKIVRGDIILPAQQLAQLTQDALALKALEKAKEFADKISPKEWHNAVVGALEPPYYVPALRRKGETASESRIHQICNVLAPYAKEFVNNMQKISSEISNAVREVAALTDKMVKLLARKDELEKILAERKRLGIVVDEIAIKENINNTRLAAAVCNESIIRREEAIVNATREILKEISLTEDERRQLACWRIAEVMEKIDDETFDFLRKELSKGLSFSREVGILSKISEKIIPQPEKIPERVSGMWRGEIIELFHKLLIEKAIAKTEDEKWIFGKVVSPVFEKL